MLQTLKSEIFSHISYIIGSKNEAARIDRRRDCQAYLDIAAKWGTRVKYVFETHRNEDYMAGSQEIVNFTKARGVGWGLARHCPGSAVASLGTGSIFILLGIASMFIGAYIRGLLDSLYHQEVSWHES